MTMRWIGAVVLTMGVVWGCGDDDDASGGDGAGSGSDHSGDTSAAGDVGASGGRVSLADGAGVDVPEGALAEEGPVSVQAVPVSSVPLPDGLSLAGEAYAFEPHGTTFESEVTLMLPYDAGAVGTVVVKLEDFEDETWEEVSGATFEDGVATVRTSSFSIYAVAEGGEGETAVDAGMGDGDSAGDGDGDTAGDGDGDAAGDGDGDAGDGDGDSTGEVPDCEEACALLMGFECENGPTDCTEWCAEQTVLYDQLTSSACGDEFIAYTDCLNLDIPANYECDGDGEPSAKDGICPTLESAWDQCFMNGL